MNQRALGCEGYTAAERLPSHGIKEDSYETTNFYGK